MDNWIYDILVGKPESELTEDEREWLWKYDQQDPTEY